jgi:hypothetical protein
VEEISCHQQALFRVENPTRKKRVKRHEKGETGGRNKIHANNAENSVGIRPIGQPVRFERRRSPFNKFLVTMVTRTLTKSSVWRLCELASREIAGVSREWSGQHGHSTSPQGAEGAIPTCEAPTRGLRPSSCHQERRSRWGGYVG